MRPGRRDGDLGQRIYNEVRRTEGSAKEKDARGQLALRWRQGVVTWRQTQVQIGALKQKLGNNRMNNPLQVLKVPKKELKRKLAFAPAEGVRAKVLTDQQKKFLANQHQRKAPAKHKKKKKQGGKQVLDLVESTSAHLKKTAVSLEGYPVLKSSGGEGADVILSDHPQLIFTPPVLMM